MGETAEPKLPNPYLAAIRAAKSRSSAPATTLTTALDAAVAAMEAGAWSGGRADSFAGSLTGWRTTSSQAAANANAEFDDAIADQPEMVERNAWQVRWRNLGPV